MAVSHAVLGDGRLVSLETLLTIENIPSAEHHSQNIQYLIPLSTRVDLVLIALS